MVDVVTQSVEHWSRPKHYKILLESESEMLWRNEQRWAIYFNSDSKVKSRSQR